MTVLCTVQDYWTITGDLSTLAAEITAAIEDATDLVEDELGRRLRSQTVTETLELWPDAQFTLGACYPTVTPVTAVTTGGTVHPMTSSAIRVTAFPDLVAADWPATTRLLEVTYTGGYTSTTCPARIKRAVAKIAAAMVASGAGATGGIPSAATAGAVRVGDVAFNIADPGAGSGVGGVDYLVPGIAATLAPFRKRLARTPRGVLA